MEALGSAIKARRIEIGLTQEGLADRMAELGDGNIRQSDISRIETGQVQLPRYERLICLAQALEVTLIELFTLAGWAEERWPDEGSQDALESSDVTGEERTDDSEDDMDPTTLRISASH